METINEGVTDHLHLSVNIRLMKPIVNVRQECVQEAIKRLFENNPQALLGHSPEEILTHLGIPPDKISRTNTSQDKPQETTKQGMLHRLKKHSMSPKSLKKFNEGRKVFRDNFVMNLF
jgi:hypothetical protein